MEFRQALPVGAILAHDYRIISVLGQGGFGLTYKAEDIRLGSPVAIKEYFPSDLALREQGATVRARSTRDETVFGWGREKFLDEARTLARFRNPNIVRVARLFEANNTAYMVLDFEDGPSLSQWRQQLGRPPAQADLDRIAAKLLDAIEAVHEAGILHRDIKPANVIMRDGEEPVLIDFGAARQALSARSKTVHAIVTPGYSPKEQYALDVDRQGSWSDIYALGATFYFLVTGATPADALSRDLDAPMPMATGHHAAYRQSFLDAIDAAMHVRADERPQTIADWRPMLLSADGPAPRKPAPPLGQPLHSGRTAATVAASRPVSSPHHSAPRLATHEEIRVAAPADRRHGRSSRSIFMLAFAAGAVIMAALWSYILVLAPERDETAWQAAVRANTVASYDAYLAAQPNGRYAATAQERRTQLATFARMADSQSPAPGSEAADVPASPSRREPDAEAQAASASQSAAAAAEPVVQAPVPAPAQKTAPPVAASVPERATLPPALAAADIDRLRQTVAPAEWRLASFWGVQVRGLTEQHTDFVRELDRLSGGKLKVTVLAGTDAPRANDILREARTQNGYFGWHTPGLSAGRRRAYSIFAGAVPFGLPPADHVRWLRAEGANLLEKLYAKDNWNFRVIPCGIGGSPGGWFRREIRTPGDLRSLKVRATPLATEVFQKVGATPVNLALNELAAAFASDRVDAAFSTTPMTAIFLRSPQPAPVYHHPSWHHPSFLMELVISGPFWQQMSEDQQRLVDEACRSNIETWAANFAASQNEVLSQIRGQRITVRPYTGPVLEVFRNAAAEVLNEEAARNPEFKEILDSYNRFRR